MRYKTFPIRAIKIGVAFGEDDDLEVVDGQQRAELERRSREVAKEVLAAPNGEKLVEAGALIGGDSGAPCCLDAQISPAEPTVIYLKPNRPDLVWNQIEPIAWELAASKRYGFLPSYRQVLVRGYGTEAPPPLVTAKQALRILIVSGATKHHVNAPLDTAAAQAHLERACCRPIPIHIDRVEGENTLEKLQSIISHGKRWDIVHVIAHGSREGKSLCLDKGGQPWFCGYAEFASELARIEDLRLVTLNVCESSTLALEIANRAPKARIVATLYL